MCTVTFIPTGNSQFVLTSNRDEAPNRKTLPPDFYSVNNTLMLFPKDQIAGGTWIGLSDKKRLVCVLNGGFIQHKRKSSYRKSRGVITKDILAAEQLIKVIEDYNFDDIEPFTMVIVDWSSDLKLYQLVWDSEKKHFSELELKPRLWSSSTLYNEDMKTQRQQWFSDYLSNDDLSAESVLEFHQTAGNDNDDYGVVMDRGFVKTTSRTQIVKFKHQVSMKYKDLNADIASEVNFEIPEAINE